MKNSRRFKIPVRWHGTEQIETARADTMVIHLDGIPREFRVTRIGTVGGKPHYRIEGDYVKREVTASKLESLWEGAEVLIERDISEIVPWVTQSKNGWVHLVSWVRFEDWRYMGRCATVYTVCREYRGSEQVARYPVGPGIATCPACLRVTSAWFPYVIEPYESPRETAKRENKLRAKARRRDRCPTAYEHLLIDAFSEDPDLPAAPPRPEPAKPTIIVPGCSRQRNRKKESEKRGKSYAEVKAELLRKKLGR